MLKKEGMILFNAPHCYFKLELSINDDELEPFATLEEGVQSLGCEELGDDEA